MRLKLYRVQVLYRFVFPALVKNDNQVLHSTTRVELSKTALDNLIVFVFKLDLVLIPVLHRKSNDRFLYIYGESFLKTSSPEIVHKAPKSYFSYNVKH